MVLPGEESPGHEEAVQASEVQPAEGGEARKEGQQRGLCYAATRQGQALQLRAQAQTHLKREKDKKRQREEIMRIQRENKETDWSKANMEAMEWQMFFVLCYVYVFMLFW